MLTFSSQAALLAVIVGVATAIAVLLRSRRPLTLRYALFAGSAALFYVVSLVRSMMQGVDFDPLHMIAAATVLVTGTRFFQALLSDHGVRATRRGRLAWIGAIALVVLALTPLTALLIARIAASALALGLLGSLVWTMEKRARDVESEAERWRLRYIAVGGGVVIVAIVVDLAAGQGAPLPQIGGVIVAIYLYILSQILVMQRLLDLHELLGKALVFSVLALTLAAVYSLLVLWAGEPGVFVFNTLLASAIILILFDPIRTWLEEKIARALFSRQRDFSRTLQRLSRSLLSLVDPDEVQTRILDTIYNSKRTTHCGFYLLEEEQAGLELTSFRGPRPEPRLEPALERVLLDQIARERAPLQRDALLVELERPAPLGGGDGDEPGRAATPSTLLAAVDAMSADVCIPIVGNTRLLGLMTLRDERVRAAFTNDEITQLLRVGDLVAVALENSRVIERLRDRDRLALLGEMAAGLAHEIRNPLGAIKSAVQYLQESAADGEGRDFLKITLAEVDRLDRVVSKFLDYARPTGGAFTPFDLNEAIRKTLKLLEAGEIPAGVKLELLLAERLPFVSGDADQIKQVIINLVLNALQAMDGAGTLRLQTEHAVSTHGTDDGHVVLRVIDSGPGIPSEVRSKLFSPFFSTREGGTGLGLAICKRVVEAHGGRVGVRGATGGGAELSVHLPVCLAVKSERELPVTDAAPQP